MGREVPLDRWLRPSESRREPAVEERPLKYDAPWTDEERALVIAVPSSKLPLLAKLLGRTLDSVRMKRETLMHLYAKQMGAKEDIGLGAHSKEDETFVRRGWCELASPDFVAEVARRLISKRG
jgi:hypothetical protein